MTYEIFHVTENRNNSAEIIQQGGVFANTSGLFLGKGYYYWEGNYSKSLDFASKYRKYYIFKGQLEMDANRLLDLCFNQHIRFLLDLAKHFKQKDLKIGLIIDLVIDWQDEKLKSGEISTEELFFPFLYSHAIDATLRPSVPERFEFSSRVSSYTYKNPESIICVYKKKDLILKSFELLKET